MPIYEFYCADCHAVFQFLARSPGIERRPRCPSCGRPELDRRPSTFAISSGRPEPEGDGADAELDESRLERAMGVMAREAGALHDDDPKGAARFLRRLYETAGLPLEGGLSEALRRMEAGEDPEAIEEEMGDVFDADPLASPAASAARTLRRRFLPPRMDPELHELP
jgi:putative FmdB family regulatory protein